MKATAYLVVEGRPRWRGGSKIEEVHVIKSSQSRPGVLRANQRAIKVELDIPDDFFIDEPQTIRVSVDSDITKVVVGEPTEVALPYLDPDPDQDPPGLNA